MRLGGVPSRDEVRVVQQQIYTRLHTAVLGRHEATGEDITITSTAVVSFC